MDASKAKLRIIEVPINVRYDVEGSTYNPLAHGVGVLGKVIGLVSQRRPLLSFCVPGAILVVSGLVFSLLVINAFNFTRMIAVGYSLIAVLCIILGTLSISTGLILNAIQGLKRV
jgi:hypothetical protein